MWRACLQSGPISVGGGMRQRKLGSHTPPCHRRMVIITLFCLGGGRGSKSSAPLFHGPQGEAAHGLHPRFVVAEIWADWGQRGGEEGGLEQIPKIL